MVPIYLTLSKQLKVSAALLFRFTDLACIISAVFLTLFIQCSRSTEMQNVRLNEGQEGSVYWMCQDRVHSWSYIQFCPSRLYTHWMPSVWAERCLQWWISWLHPVVFTEVLQAWLSNSLWTLPCAEICARSSSILCASLKLLTGGGCYASFLKCSILLPSLKSEGLDPNDTVNNWPISAFLSNIIEIIIACEITLYVVSNNLLPLNQSGFIKKNYSTESLYF